MGANKKSLPVVEQTCVTCDHLREETHVSGFWCIKTKRLPSTVTRESKPASWAPPAWCPGWEST